MRHGLSVPERSRDLVLRITNWTDDEDEPAYDVECYIAGVYDFNESKTFRLNRGYGKISKDSARWEATAFAQQQIAKLINKI